MAKQFIKNLVPFSINGIFPKSSLDGAYTLSSLTFNNNVIEKPFVSSIYAYFSVTGDSLNIRLFGCILIKILKIAKMVV